MTENLIDIKIKMDGLTELEDIWDIVSNIYSLSQEFFILCVDGENLEENLKDLLELKTILESCLTELKFILESDNPLINELNKSHSTLDILERYFDNLFSVLDTMEDKLKGIVKDADDRYVKNQWVVEASIKSLRERFIGYMKDLVNKPLSNALRKYVSLKKKDIELRRGEEIIKLEKKEIFEYILFKEVWTSCKIKGSTERKKALVSGNLTSATFEEKNIINRGRRREEYEKIQEPPEIDDFEDLYIEDNI